MQDRRAEIAVGLVLENRPLQLGRLAACQPEVLAAAWGDILLALAATDGIDTEALLGALRPVLHGASPRRSLNDPLDADANRAAHWAALYGQTAKLDALRRTAPTCGCRTGSAPRRCSMRSAAPVPPPSRRSCATRGAGSSTT